MDYSGSPKKHADYLRWEANRQDEAADARAAEGKPWSAGDADRGHRTARRLRAMALLCDRSTAVRVGDVDFYGLTDPTMSREDEEAIVTEIEAGATPQRRGTPRHPI